jgi:hypothetical protein
MLLLLLAAPAAAARPRPEADDAVQAADAAVGHLDESEVARQRR